MIHGDFGQDAVLLPLEGVVSIGNFSAVVMQIIAMLKLEWGLEGCGRGKAKGGENSAINHFGTVQSNVGKSGHSHFVPLISSSLLSLPSCSSFLFSPSLQTLQRPESCNSVPKQERADQVVRGFSLAQLQPFLKTQQLVLIPTQLIDFLSYFVSPLPVCVCVVCGLHSCTCG